MKGATKELRTLLLGSVLAGSALLTAYAIGRPSHEATPPGATSAAAVEASGVGASWDLPLKRTDRVAYFEDLLSGARRGKMRLWLEQSGRYVPMIRRELRARGMPEDLVYLAFIESGFSPDALSRTRAVGLWQFMESTGKELGLKVTPYVDQRRDPVAATDAALDFLRDLHRQFGSWWLAAAAYNCGPGRVARVLRQETGRSQGDDETYWAIAPHLPKETQDYVPLILAAGEIAKNPEKYGFNDLSYHEPLSFDTVQVPGGTRLATISQATGADSTVVDQLNPHYLKNVTPPVKASAWAVRIPQGLTRAFVANFPHLFALQKQADVVAGASARERAADRHRLAKASRRHGSAKRAAKSEHSRLAASASAGSRSHDR